MIMMMPLRRRFLFILPGLLPSSSCLSPSTILQHHVSTGSSNRWLPSTRSSSSTTAMYHSSSPSSSGNIPDEHKKSYRLKGVGKNSAVTLTTDTGHVLQTDVPKSMGGDDTAPQPVETLLAAWLGCTQATAVFVGRQLEPRILLESLEFEVIAIRDQRGALELPITKLPDVPARLQCIEGTITVHIKQSKRKEPQCLTDEQLELLSEQTEARCPVANMMMASGCELKITWVNGAATSSDE